MSMIDKELKSRPATSTSTEVQLLRPSSTSTITEVVDEAGAMRASIGVLRSEVDELHQDVSQVQVTAFYAEVEHVTADKAKQGIRQLLESLAELGFSWREVARLAGVSVPAVHKWRAGGGSTAENRRALARLVALCTLLSRRFLISDVAGWLEMPLLSEVPVSGLDLLAKDRIDLLLRWAGHTDVSPQDILDEFEPDWRQIYEGSAFEVFTAPDGLPAIRFRENQD